MPAPSYTGITGGAIALSAATAKSILGARAHANSGLLLTHASVSFDGITPLAVPVLAELCYATFATNGTAGTNNTTVTAVQTSGRVITAGFTMMKTWTSEPTVLTVIEELLIPAYGGGIVYDFPLGTECDSAVSEGFVIRCNAPATVNVRATIKVSRC